MAMLIPQLLLVVPIRYSLGCKSMMVFEIGRNHAKQPIKQGATQYISSTGKVHCFFWVHQEGEPPLTVRTTIEGILPAPIIQGSMPAMHILTVTSSAFYVMYSRCTCSCPDCPSDSIMGTRRKAIDCDRLECYQATTKLDTPDCAFPGLTFGASGNGRGALAATRSAPSVLNFRLSQRTWIRKNSLN